MEFRQAAGKNTQRGLTRRRATCLYGLGLSVCLTGWVDGWCPYLSLCYFNNKTKHDLSVRHFAIINWGLLLLLLLLLLLRVVCGSLKLGWMDGAQVIMGILLQQLSSPECCCGNYEMTWGAGGGGGEERAAAEEDDEFMQFRRRRWLVFDNYSMYIRYHDNQRS